MRIGRTKTRLDTAGARPVRLFVPGRVEVLGKHTDYAGGRSLLCAVERGFTVVVVPQDGLTVTMTNDQTGKMVKFPLAADIIPVVGHWSNYPMTVARRVAHNFPGRLRGCDITFHSDLPPAAGLSSSSAFVVATFMALSHVNELEDHPAYRANIRTTEDLAGYLGTVENGQTFAALVGDAGVGTFGGSEDHTAILCAGGGILRQYAFCPVRHERDVPMPPGHTFVIGVSGVTAEKTGAARERYNDVSLRARAIAAEWTCATGQVATLGDVVRAGESERLRQILQGSGAGSSSYAPADLLARFEQFAAESDQIIPEASTALTAGRLDEFGRLVDRSQANAESMLRNQVGETIFLARVARELGAVAASSFGAGFGGSVWALVRNAEAATFGTAWERAYTSRYPEHASRFMHFTTGAGRPARRLMDV